MPTEAEMLAKDKYTIFDRKEKRYRKGIHSTWDLYRIWVRLVLAANMDSRTPQVDSRVAKTQPTWFLNERRWA